MINKIDARFEFRWFGFSDLDIDVSIPYLTIYNIDLTHVQKFFSPKATHV